jgi:two-component system NarL family sensor kinase
MAKSKGGVSERRRNGPGRAGRRRGAQTPESETPFRLTIDRDWRILSISPSAARWGGSTPGELIGSDSRQRWPLPPALVEAIVESFASGAPSTVEFASVMIPGRWVEFRIAPSEGGADIAFEDITQRIAARRRLTAPNAADPFNVGGGTTEIALLDDRGVVVSVNAAWRAAAAAFSPRFAGAGVGERYVDICTRVVPYVDAAALASDLDALIAGRTSLFEATYGLPTSTHEQLRQVQITRLVIGPKPYFVAVHEDLTAQQEVASALRATSERLLHAREDERRRIALELHDSTSQNLAALAMNLVRLSRLTETIPQAAALVKETSLLVQDTVRETRVLSFLMAASGVEQHGLKESARRFVEGFGRRTGLEATFAAEGPVDKAGDATRHAIFRVIQEALTNAYRHSGATRVSVEIASRAGEITARVRDNGRGMPPSVGDSEAPLGVGIPGMRARMDQLGGDLDITSDPQGTTVTSRAPAGRRPKTMRQGGRRRAARPGNADSPWAGA